MAKKVFVSYSRQDAQSVRYLVDTLTAIGYDVWIDQANLRLGDNWWNGILHGIRRSCVVAVRARVRTGKLGLAFCLAGILGTVLDSIKIGWPFPL